MVEARESSEVLSCFLTGDKQVYEAAEAANRIISERDCLASENGGILTETQWRRGRGKKQAESGNLRLSNLTVLVLSFYICKLWGYKM